MSTQEYHAFFLAFLFKINSTSLCNETKNEDLPRSCSYALDNFLELYPNSLVPFSDKASEHFREIIPVGVSIQSREHNASTADCL